ncbi:MFS transporter [Brucella pituitosa]|uniref:MFS transporter n=1 Tax=Brucella pituitosa TaxID=571256 RepID=UPI003F4A8F61
MNYSTPTTATGAGAVQPSAFKTFLISGIGTALEYYDFLIYGLAAALVFNTQFFPSDDPLIGTVIAFAVFGTGFVARPLGGIVIGHFGDIIGRRKMLVLTLTIMGIATFLVGCLPVYSQVGIWAPIMLVVLRLVQGFAAGGEWGGAALIGMESAPVGKRGLWGSFTSMGIGLALVLAPTVFSITSALSGDNFVSFGWRVPFWIGGVLVLIGIGLRLSSMSDEPAIKGSKSTARAPLVDAMLTRPRQILLVGGVSYGFNTIAYIGFFFFLTYALRQGHDRSFVLFAQLVYGAVGFFATPLFAALSDKIGRKPVMVGGAAIIAAYMFAFFLLVHAHSFSLLIFAFAVAGLVSVIPQGPLPAFLAEQFPARMRFSGLSLGYQVGAALGGGTGAMIATWLLIVFQDNAYAVSAYGVLAVSVMGGCSLALSETHKTSNVELDED